MENKKEKSIKKIESMMSLYSIISIRLNGELVYLNENYWDKNNLQHKEVI